MAQLKTGSTMNGVALIDTNDSRLSDARTPTSHSHAMADLSDFNITAITNNEVLVWDGTDFINQTLAEAGIASATHNHDGTYEPANSNIQTHIGTTTGNPHSLSVNDLTDATITSLSDGEILVSSSNVFINQTLSEAGIQPFPSINTKSASVTLALTDANDFLNCTNSSNITLTVPPNSSVAFPIGTQIAIAQRASGTVTFAPGSGVTINSKDSNLTIDGQYATASLIKISSDTWVLTGALTT